MNYKDCLNYINSLGKSSGKPGLEKIKYLCGLFDNPQEACAHAHIAGTNGKGSATAMLADIIQAAGHKTGRFISPYIYDFTERISINGSDISRDDIILYTQKIKRVLDNIPQDYQPNTFQFVTLLAFLYFRDKSCDLTVLETGLGGRLDPTNIIKSPLVSIIMQIGLDHANTLVPPDYTGDIIEQIAREKCGIIKANSALVLYPVNPPSVINIAEQTARERNCAFIMPDLDYLKILDANLTGTLFKYKNKKYNIKLAGTHQVYNAVTVIEAAEYLQQNYNAICNGIEKTRFPSRFEIISHEPLIIFDGAHNIPAVCTLRDNIKNLLPDKKIILICGMLKDKEPEHILKYIAGESFIKRFIAVPVDIDRAETPETLRDIAAQYGANACACHDLREAMREAARDNLAVICFGSLYLAEGVKRACAYGD